MKSIIEAHKQELGKKFGVAAAVQVADHYQKIYSYGVKYNIYDLASLTKVIFMAPAVALAVEKGLITFGTSVQRVLPWFPYRIPLRRFLNHTSQMDWWLPIFKKIDMDLDRDLRWQIVARAVRAQQLVPTQNARYSDVGVLTIAMVLQRVFESPLTHIWDEVKTHFCYPKGLEFHLDNKVPKAVQNYAPTEHCLWRNKVVQGQVHDENCYALAGISTHAGLFASIQTLAKWSLQMRELTHSHPVLSKMVQRSIPSKVGDWGLGFAKPTPKTGKTGAYFDDDSYGHWGFTGTSWWHSPNLDVSVMLLSNRVNPTRENKTFVHLRPLIHNAIIEDLYNKGILK